MPTIFPVGPGTVVRVDDGRQAVPFRFNLPGFGSNAAIITSAGMQHEGNAQFLHSVSEFIYIYVFGDRIGSLSVEGTVFMSKCDGPTSGMDDVLNYYGQNRVAARAGPLRVGFGALAFSCFLLGGNFRAMENGDMGIMGQFAFTLKTFPTG